MALGLVGLVALCRPSRSRAAARAESTAAVPPLLAPQVAVLANAGAPLDKLHNTESTADRVVHSRKVAPGEAEQSATHAFVIAFDRVVFGAQRSGPFVLGRGSTSRRDVGPCWRRRTPRLDFRSLTD